MACRYLICYYLTHPEFAPAEFASLAHLFGLDLKKTTFIGSGKLSPLSVVEVDGNREKQLRQILARSVLTRSIFELWATASDYPALYQQLSQIYLEKKAEKENCFGKEKTFCFRMNSLRAKRPQSYLVQRMEELWSSMPFEGRANMSDPSNTFHFIELHRPIEEADGEEGALALDDSSLELVCFGRLIGKGQATLPNRFRLEERHYIGNTSMDPCLSLVQANLAQAAPSRLALDPFAGTGSLLIAAAHYGAYCVGTEIKYNVVHGLGKSSRVGVGLRGPNENVRANFAQYGLADRYLDIVLADASRPGLWRSLSLFHAILADPPYGIREKGAKVGAKDKSKKEDNSRANAGENAVHHPEKMPYRFSDLYLDLLNFSARYLRLHGRLTFWFPVLLADYSDENLPRHPCLRLLHSCLQKLSKTHGRRLIVMEKTEELSALQRNSASIPVDPYEDRTFRDRVMGGNYS